MVDELTSGMPAHAPLDSTRVLIITLHSGENEFDQCKASVMRQTIRNVEQVIISGLPNLEAHQALQKVVMEQKEDFDFFVKLDADMAFRSEWSLAILLGSFSDPDIEHLVAPVFDAPSQSNINGISIFRSGVVWGAYRDALFTDTGPVLTGRRVTLDMSRPAEVIHMADPSPEQAFQFGVHRATKIVQRDRILKESGSAGFQIDLLSRIADVATNTDDDTRKLMLFGAESVLRGRQVLMERKDSTGVDDRINAMRIVASRRGQDWPLRSWITGAPRLKWRRFRYARLPTIWSKPLRLMSRLGYRLYAGSGLRKVWRMRLVK